MLAFSRQSIGPLALFILMLSVPALAQEHPTITFDNRSGDNAVVRLAGPTSGVIEVANSTARTGVAHTASTSGTADQDNFVTHAETHLPWTNRRTALRKSRSRCTR
jgi:hypothetical protein